MSPNAKRLAGIVAGVAGFAAAAVAVSPVAAATELVATTVSADDSKRRSCQARPAPRRRGVAARFVTAPAGGWVTARLAGARRGDWDLAIFDARTRRLVGASAGFGTTEVAQGIAARGSRLIVQACRRSGRARRAKLTVELDRVKASAPVRARLVRVPVPNPKRLAELESLGLDVTEHGGDGFREIVLYGAKDAAKLRRANFLFTVEVADLRAMSARQRAAERRYAAATSTSALPSGRTTYRRLGDYGMDLKRLVDENPGLVRPITLPHETFEGRQVEGIEIAKDVGASDGRPVFLQMGAHHAREWPSADHAMEWAFELVNGYKAGDRRAKALLEETRTIVVPVVNPDGFNISREAGELQGAGNGRGDVNELVNIAAHPYEYRRKNCRNYDDSDEGNCLQPSFGLREPGVDPNRNYGGFWGGAGTFGSSARGRLEQTYRGKAPFSEPETQNIRELVSARQVTALITNHTYSNLVLRPPGVESQGKSPDEALLKQLGAAMTAQNGYRNIHSYQLYDTTGTTEDWSYYATGGLGYTYEIGPEHFHPPFQDIVDEWTGDTEDADALNPDSQGNREAYYLIHEAAADPAKHAVITGKAPAGVKLRLSKTFDTPTSLKDDDGNTVTFEDTLSSELELDRAGKFEWHVNPSTRPLVAPRVLKTVAAEPSEEQEFGATALVPSAGDVLIEDVTYDDHEFEVREDHGAAGVRVRIEWTVPGNDYDLFVYRKLGNRLILESSSTSDNSQTNDDGKYEEQVLVEDPLPATYVARVENWLAATDPNVTGTIGFHPAGEDKFIAGSYESWELECVDRHGRTSAVRKVTVGRGERVDAGAVCAKR